MPIKDWRCLQCGATFEKTLKVKEAEEFVPESEFTCCEKQQLQRYIPPKSGATFSPTAAWRSHGSKGNW